MEDLGFDSDTMKDLGGWALEKVGRLKLNGQLTGYSPLSRVVELEGLDDRNHGRSASGSRSSSSLPDEPRLDADPARAPARARREPAHKGRGAARARGSRSVRRLSTPRASLPACPGSPSSRSCAGARSSRGGWAARSGSRASARRGRLTVRERIERLFDAGRSTRPARSPAAATYDEDGRADRLPARQHDRRPGPHRRPPRGRAGRRLHRPRRRRRRRHLGEGGVRRAAGARPAPPARPARRRHRRRRQRQVARADGLLLRAAAAGLRPRREEPLARSRGRRGARTGGRASARRAWSAPTSP